MSTFSLIVAFALAASPDEGTPSAAASGKQPSASAVASAAPRTMAEWRQTISDALRREATSQGDARLAALKDLVGLYEKIASANRLAQSQRDELQGTIRARLARSSGELERLVQRATRKPASVDSDRLNVLAQQAPAGNRGRAAGAALAGRGAAPDVAGAQALIDLIHNTIAPASWDVNGGQGTIFYFGPKQVLVIRATEDVHELIGGTIGSIRN